MTKSSLTLTQPLDGKSIYEVRPITPYYQPHSKIARLNGSMPDIIDLMVSMTSAERSTLQLLKTNYDYQTNKVLLDRKVLTSTQKQHLNTAYKGLVKKGLVKRIKQNHYLLSPYYFLPSSKAETLELFYKEWGELKT